MSSFTYLQVRPNVAFFARIGVDIYFQLQLRQRSHFYSEATCLKRFIRISNGLKESDLPITPLLLQHGYCSSFPFKTHMPAAASY